MMNNTKWLRRALLGGVALGVMATGAQADELSKLKAQLEGLQSRVNQLEQQPSVAALPEGASYITLSRGSADIKEIGTFAPARDHRPADRGFTIAITPTADLPAPVAEVVVYGYVKGDVIYDFDGIKSDTFFVPGLFSNPNRGRDHVRLHAWQSRFGIRSRTDTAIGQIRTQIEGDFFGAPFGDVGEFRLRHAVGEWDVTPNWTFLAGQTWRTAVLLPIGVTTVDFSSSAGPFAFPRAAQVRMTYHSGPITWAVAAERPTFTSSARWPNFSSYIQFDAPGGHQFIATGTVADYRGRGEGRSDRRRFHSTGWAVQAGANINLADIATLTAGGLYGEGEHCTYLSQTGQFCGLLDRPNKFDGLFLSDRGWGVVAGLSFGLTDTTTFNVSYGFNELDNGLGFGPSRVHVQTLHGNILWRPVRQMQLGWELMWGEYRFRGGDFARGARRSDDAIRAQFGAWFFF